MGYVSSPERRAANLQAFVDRVRQADPAQAQQLQAVFADPDLFGKMDRELRKHGMRVDKVADAYATWWISAWQAAHGDTGQPSERAVRAVKAQAERAFAASPLLLEAGDGAKQAFAEGLLIQSVLLDAALDQIQRDPRQKAALASVARQAAKRAGIDLDSMVLTDQGFGPAA